MANFVKMHHDDSDTTQPFYTISLNGHERNTVRSKLAIYPPTPVVDMTIDDAMEVTSQPEVKDKQGVHVKIEKQDDTTSPSLFTPAAARVKVRGHGRAFCSRLHLARLCRAPLRSSVAHALRVRLLACVALLRARKRPQVPPLLRTRRRQPVPTTLCTTRSGARS